jgi:hypothetical protein
MISPLRIALAALCTLVSTLVAFAAVHISNTKCRLLLQPTHCQSYSGAKATLPLPKKFGHLVQYESQRPGATGCCLYVHALQYNASDYRFLTTTLLQHFQVVFALEPRGYGLCQDSPSLASILLSIRIAHDQIAQTAQQPVHLVAHGLGANLARFSSFAFRIPFASQLYAAPVSSTKLFSLVPWMRECKTGALFDWNDWFSRFPNVRRVTLRP